MENDYHLNKRYERYYINSIKKGFVGNLKGLTTIELCITELCTRKCSFCPRADSKVYPNKKLFMSIETITNLANKCLEDGFEGDFHVSGFGESFTHPDFLELITVLRNKLPNNFLVLTTNGDLLNEKNLKEIIKKNFNKVIVSCYDGLKRKEELIKFFERNSYFNYEIRELWFNPGEDTKDLMNRNNFNNRSGSVVVGGIVEPKNNAQCYLPFYKLVIDWNGEALLCCNDWKRAHKGFGNVNTNTLSEIWNGSEFKTVRESLYNGNRQGPACSNCNIAGTMIGTESVSILIGNGDEN